LCLFSFLFISFQSFYLPHTLARGLASPTYIFILYDKKIAADENNIFTYQVPSNYGPVVQGTVELAGSDSESDPNEVGKTNSICTFHEVRTISNHLDYINFEGLGTVLEILSFDKYLYAIYNDMSIQAFSLEFSEFSKLGTSSAVFQNSTYYPKHSSVTSEYTQAKLLYSSKQKMFQIWTQDFILEFYIDPKTGKLTMNETLFPVNLKGIEQWKVVRHDNDLLYIVFNDELNAIYRYQMAPGGMLTQQQKWTFVATNISDFWIENNYLYVLDWDTGAYVYDFDKNGILSGVRGTISFTNGERIIAARAMVAIGHYKNPHHFEIVEYLKRNAGTLSFTKNQERVIHAFKDFMADDNRIITLKSDQLEFKYHSITTSLQPNLRLVEHVSPVLYAEKFISGSVPINLQSSNVQVIYTLGENIISANLVVEKPADVLCTREDLKQQEQNELVIKVKMKALTCPQKESQGDIDPDSYCEMHQKIILDLDHGKPIGMILSICFLSVIIVILLAGWYHSHKKLKQNNKNLEAGFTTLKKRVSELMTIHTEEEPAKNLLNEKDFQILDGTPTKTERDRITEIRDTPMTVEKDSEAIISLEDLRVNNDISY